MARHVNARLKARQKMGDPALLALHTSTDPGLLKALIDQVRLEHVAKKWTRVLNLDFFRAIIQNLAECGAAW